MWTCPPGVNGPQWLWLVWFGSTTFFNGLWNVESLFCRSEARFVSCKSPGHCSTKWNCFCRGSVQQKQTAEFIFKLQTIHILYSPAELHPQVVCCVHALEGRVSRLYQVRKTTGLVFLFFGLTACLCLCLTLSQISNWTCRDRNSVPPL